MHKLYFCLLTVALFSTSVFSDELIAESDVRPVYNNPTCRYTHAFVTPGADSGCSDKTHYAVEALAYFEADCLNLSNKPMHLSIQNYLHLAVFKDFEWDKSQLSWYLGNRKIAQCNEYIYGQPKLEKDLYYTVELIQPQSGMLSVKAKLFRREKP